MREERGEGRAVYIKFARTSRMEWQRLEMTRVFIDISGINFSMKNSLDLSSGLEFLISFPFHFFSFHFLSFSYSYVLHCHPSFQRCFLILSVHLRIMSSQGNTLSSLPSASRYRDVPVEIDQLFRALASRSSPALAERLPPMTHSMTLRLYQTDESTTTGQLIELRLDQRPIRRYNLQKECQHQEITHVLCTHFDEGPFLCVLFREQCLLLPMSQGNRHILPLPYAIHRVTPLSRGLLMQSECLSKGEFLTILKPFGPVMPLSFPTVDDGWGDWQLATGKALQAEQSEWNPEIFTLFPIPLLMTSQEADEITRIVLRDRCTGALSLWVCRPSISETFTQNSWLVRGGKDEELWSGQRTTREDSPSSSPSRRSRGASRPSLLSGRRLSQDNARSVHRPSLLSSRSPLSDSGSFLQSPLGTEGPTSLSPYTNDPKERQRRPSGGTSLEIPTKRDQPLSRPLIYREEEGLTVQCIWQEEVDQEEETMRETIDTKEPSSPLALFDPKDDMESDPCQRKRYAKLRRLDEERAQENTGSPTPERSFDASMKRSLQPLMELGQERKVIERSSERFSLTGGPPSRVYPQQAGLVHLHDGSCALYVVKQGRVSIRTFRTSYREVFIEEGEVIWLEDDVVDAFAVVSSRAPLLDLVILRPDGSLSLWSGAKGLYLPLPPDFLRARRIEEEGRGEGNGLPQKKGESSRCFIRRIQSRGDSQSGGSMQSRGGDDTTYSGRGSLSVPLDGRIVLWVEEDEEEKRWEVDLSLISSSKLTRTCLRALAPHLAETSFSTLSHLFFEGLVHSVMRKTVEAEGMSNQYTGSKGLTPGDEGGQDDKQSEEHWRLFSSILLSSLNGTFQGYSPQSPGEKEVDTEPWSTSPMPWVHSRVFEELRAFQGAYTIKPCSPSRTLNETPFFRPNRSFSFIIKEKEAALIIQVLHLLYQECSLHLMGRASCMMLASLIVQCMEIMGWKASLYRERCFEPYSSSFGPIEHHQSADHGQCVEGGGLVGTLRVGAGDYFACINSILTLLYPPRPP